MPGALSGMYLWAAADGTWHGVVAGRDDRWTDAGGAGPADPPAAGHHRVNASWWSRLVQSLVPQTDGDDQR